jgi:hypothetical protein
MLTLTAQEMPELVRRRTADRHRDQPITQHSGLCSSGRPLNSTGSSSSLIPWSDTNRMGAGGPDSVALTHASTVPPSILRAAVPRSLRDTVALLYLGGSPYMPVVTLTPAARQIRCI